MSESVPINFENAYLFSLLNYGAPLMFNTNAKIIIKMHNLHMACCRWAQGNFRFEQSCNQICKSIGKKVSTEEFFDVTARFCQKLMFHQEQRAIIAKLKLLRRACVKIGLKKYDKKKKFKTHS